MSAPHSPLAAYALVGAHGESEVYRAGERVFILRLRGRFSRVSGLPASRALSKTSFTFALILCQRSRNAAWRSARCTSSAC